jgi:ABC-type multidrug transport system fused ATPase/permease subunit
MLYYRGGKHIVQRFIRNHFTPYKYQPIASTFHSSISRLSDSNKQDVASKIDVNSVYKLFHFSKPEWSLIGASTGTLVVTTSITLFLPYASGKLMDITIAGDAAATSPFLMSGGLFGLICISGIGIYFRRMWLSKAGNRIVARLRQQAFQKMVIQDLPYLEHISTGDFLSRLSADTQIIQSVVTSQSVAGFRSICIIAGSASMLFYTSPMLATMSLCTLPPIFISARHVGSKLQEQQLKVQELQAEATSYAEQALSGIKTVKQFNGEEYESHRYAMSVAHAHRTALDTAHMQAQLEGLTDVASRGAFLGVFVYGGSLVLQGDMTGGDLTGFILYSFLMAANLSLLSGVYADFSRAIAASDRVMEILERTPKTPPPSSTMHLYDDPLNPPSYIWCPPPSLIHEGIKNEPTSVRIQNLTFAYPTRSEIPVLHNLSLVIEPGKVLSLVGGSGSGKSTIASLLTRLYEVPRGSIYINDQDLHDFTPEDLRQQIGIVSQEPTLFKGSITDNIRYGMWSSTQEEVYEAANLAHVLDFANQFPLGMDTMVGAKGAQLSGGQKQRVAIARCLLKNPPFVILDEATSALDAQSEHLVQQALSRIMTSNKTVLSIAHRLSTIRHSDRIAVMKHGKIVEEGTFEELTKKTDGPFWQLMKMQLLE